ncbi:MAG: hypothetical protein ABIK92_06140 [Pseudomonadota bacterium]
MKKLNRIRNMRMVLITTLVISILFSVGCAQKYAFNTGLPASDISVTEWQHQGFYDYAIDNRFDLDKACSEGV